MYKISNITIEETPSKNVLNHKKAVIKNLLNCYKIRNYTINDDLSVDVNGNVDIYNQSLKIIPIKFGNIDGSFNCGSNNLTNLKGAPKSVSGDFCCSHNQLTSLVGSPETVGRDFYCDDNQLVNLAGSPEIIQREFYCDKNKLINLLGSPKIVKGYFACGHNKLTSLVELINCDFKEKIYFNIDTKNFAPKELIKILEKYYDLTFKHYELTDYQFCDIIRPQLEKYVLEEELNLNKAENNIKSKSMFI